MALDVTTLLIPPDGSGEIDYRWFDWLPTSGSGQSQKEAVIELMEGYKTAGEAALTAAGLEVTDPPVQDYVYWKSFSVLCKEYGRRVGSTTIHNEVTTSVGTATSKEFCNDALMYKARWEQTVPASTPTTAGGTTASVRSHFMF
jgi:hypothetical protein